MDAIEQFNRDFPKFMSKFGPGDTSMVIKLLMDIFKYPLSHRLYLRIARATKPVPRNQMNDCNYNQYAIDEDLERFVKVGLIKEVEGTVKVQGTSAIRVEGGYVLV